MPSRRTTTCRPPELRQEAVDPLLHDEAVFRGRVPKDISTKHDSHLYGPDDLHLRPAFSAGGAGGDRTLRNTRTDAQPAQSSDNRPSASRRRNSGSPVASGQRRRIAVAAAKASPKAIG